MALLAHIRWSDFIHPGGSGYWFYSGAFDFSIFVAAVAFVLGWWRHHNCHVHKCPRVSWHPHPVHGHPVCKRHHPDHPTGGGSPIHHFTGSVVYGRHDEG